MNAHFIAAFWWPNTTTGGSLRSCENFHNAVPPRTGMYWDVLHLSHSVNI